ncbi:MAG: NAD(P)H-dependent oxidoreductase [Oscillospiraceae bacterium]|jgi:multimeric flavodoxin WrbA|nr:NAD(P)H-dependent oxidoreductase [Oscillospiraceae bacterium]
MKVTAIHSKPLGSTHAVAGMLLGEIKKSSPDAEVREFVVAGFKPCAGCFSCFSKGEEHCPHYGDVHPIITAIEESDVVILDCPTYCLGISGAMKSFLDHLGYRWFAHRPHPSMKHKIGVAISTTGTLGAKAVTKALKSQFFGLTAAKCYRLSFSVAGFDWNDVKDNKKRKIARAVQKTARKVAAGSGRANRSLYLRFILRAMRIVQSKNDWFPLDKAWWQKQGWIGT